MKRFIFLALFLSVVAIPVFTFPSSWEIDPDHSSIQFKVRHLTVSNVKGEFSKAKGAVLIDDQDITNLKVEISIDATSVNTGHAKRDDHLRNPDFFDVARFPTITFISKKVMKAGPDQLKVVGDLTIRNVTREVTVDIEGPTPEVKDFSGNLRRGATGTAKINRRDFGITWNRTLDTGGLVVGDDVNITVEVELIKKK